MNTLYFSNKILLWYLQNKRNLPWRQVSDPYLIWISEVILQQTRIDQGLNYYMRFIEQFPDVHQLANADLNMVLKIWQGLGYYSRARNLHTGAKMVVQEFNGIFPQSANELKKIKGIGDYTSAAIASIAFNEIVPAIDGNAYRVLSRIYGIQTPIDTSTGKKQFKELAEKLIDKQNPGDYNQAVMDFGAIVCTPRNPQCIECPFTDACIAKDHGTISLLPVKEKKLKQRNRHFYYMVIEDKGAIYFKQRAEKDIWQNLFDFPLIEFNAQKNIEEITASQHWKKLFNNNIVSIESVSDEFQHILTHQRIFARFIHIRLKSENKLPSNFQRIDKRNIFELAVPKLIENYLVSKNL